MAYPIRDERPSRGTTWATWGLIGLCVFVFAFVQPKPMQGITRGRTFTQQSDADLQIRHFTDRWALVPCEVTHGKSIAAGAACDGYPVDDPGAYVAKNVWLPLLTALFLHENIWHLLSNMLFLWIFGRGLEQRVGTAGTLGLFVAGGIASFLGYVALNPESMNPLLGASGAIAAFMGAYLVLLPERRVLSFVYAAGLQVVYLPAWSVLAFFFVSQFFTSAGSRVAWQAHVTGMFFGAAVGFLWKWRDPSLRHETATTVLEPSDPTPRPDAWPSLPPSSPPG